MSHYGKNRVNKGLYGNSKRNHPYTNANMKVPKELVMPMIDFETIRRRIEFVIDMPNLLEQLGIKSEAKEKGMIILSPAIDIPEIRVSNIDDFGAVNIVIYQPIDNGSLVKDFIVKELKDIIVLLEGRVKNEVLGLLKVKK